MSDHFLLSAIVEALPDVPAQHARTTPLYRLLDAIAVRAAHESPLTRTDNARVQFGDLGEIDLPYERMGAIDSLDLFGLDELILFAFYRTNRALYATAADIGANLGLHTILMVKCGWRVLAYEPDPRHAMLLRRNLELNGCSSVELHESAVSAEAGTREFVRVLGNTTGSHLTGAKANPYGELERFPVHVEAIRDIMHKVDLIKVDAEGEERNMVLATTAEDWHHVDMFVEVASEANAEAIYVHLTKLGVNAFAQKQGWRKVRCEADVPTSYKQGSLFVSNRAEMPWPRPR